MPQLQNLDDESVESMHKAAGPPGAKSATSDEKILWRRGYTLGKLLGEGSYAKVYLSEYSEAHIKDRRQKLACKVIDGASAPRDFLRRFFPREVEIMSRINHQNLVRVHSILQRKHKYFLFMQFCENGDLLDFIRQNGAIREKQCRIWFCQIIRGMHYLHERNIAHRDMKCENILLTKSFNIKISDFGFARYILPDEGKSETFCGSVSYAPPEIIRGQPYEPKGADLWSIGVILFVMLNKSMPFDDASLRKLYECQMSRQWKFRNKMKDLLSTDVKSFLYVLLEPLPERRKPLPELWQDAWIQKGSNIDLQLEKDAASRATLNQSSAKPKAAAAPPPPPPPETRTVPDSSGGPSPAPAPGVILQPPVKIIDAETAEVKPFAPGEPSHANAIVQGVEGSKDIK